nr:MAG TPA: transcriptional activator [Caudoviricetes sp.]
MCQQDCIFKTKKALRSYKDLKDYVANAHAMINDLTQRLAVLPAPKVPKLSFSGGSGDGTSPQERAYMQREAMIEKIKMLTLEINRVEPMIARIDDALDRLEDVDKIIITRRLVNNESWILISSDLNASESYCRKRLPKIVESLAIKLFGTSAMPEQEKFNFNKEGEK